MYLFLCLNAANLKLAQICPVCAFSTVSETTPHPSVRVSNQARQICSALVERLLVNKLFSPSEKQYFRVGESLSVLHGMQNLVMEKNFTYCVLHVWQVPVLVLSWLILRSFELNGTDSLKGLLGVTTSFLLQVERTEHFSFIILIHVG